MQLTSHAISWCAQSQFMFCLDWKIFHFDSLLFMFYLVSLWDWGKHGSHSSVFVCLFFNAEYKLWHSDSVTGWRAWVVGSPESSTVFKKRKKKIPHNKSCLYYSYTGNRSCCHCVVSVMTLLIHVFHIILTLQCSFALRNRLCIIYDSWHGLL